ncbi:hypothetical protein SAMN04488136_13269 [Vibrio xiamenensis]|uniref:Uncharacterized protein n=1 Tax=Vibrio xiamenensis TaxID=861298 RepID=A0A1G8FUN3_9VIBR|nr:hypothetical protein [Vibrio xiamenensis]SDH85852.1 hypothetical protein SAMN04488136_13269 [Vibrio xiamenensis]
MMEYNFDDEYALDTQFDVKNKRLKIKFGAYYYQDKTYEKECCLIISDWLEAKYKLCRSSNDFKCLSDDLEAILLVLDVKRVDEYTVFVVMTEDDRYLDFYFLEPCLEVEVF